MWCIIYLGSSITKGVVLGLVNDSISDRFDYSGLLSDALLVVSPCGIQVKRQSKIIYGGNVSRANVRGVITGRSSKSNRRLMNFLSQIDFVDFAALDVRQNNVNSVFLTLTYPGEYSSDMLQYKNDLNKFRKRLKRAFSLNWAIWFLEFQARGAPHYHLVLTFNSVIDLSYFRSWCSSNWYDCVHSGDIKHFKAGTQATALYLSRGTGTLMNYLSREVNHNSSKNYQFVSYDRDTGELLSTGRTWGMWNKENIDFIVIATLTLSGVEWIKFKDNVSGYYKDSPYLSSINTFSWWGGALLYGDGLQLLDFLFSNIHKYNFL